MQAFLSMYMSILDEIEDNQFEDEGVRVSMRRRYKGPKKGNTGQSLCRMYKAELTKLWTFAKKIHEIAAWQSSQVDIISSVT